MSSSTKWTSRALVAAGAGGLLVLGAAFGPGDVTAASADDTPPPEHPTRGAPERPGTLPSTTALPEPPITAAPGRGTLPPLAAPAHGVPPYGG